MSDNKEKRIKDGLFGLAPDSFKEIMNREPVRMESEEELFGVPLNMDAGRARISVRRRRISVLAAAAAVIVCVFSWAMFDQLHAVDMLCIDVNPSINVTLNKAGHVRSVKGENQEGEAIVTGAAGELKGVSEPDQVLTVLLEELDADGYFKDQEMDLLLTFVFTDNSRIGVLDSVKEAADNYAKAQGLKETVIAQSIPKDGAAAQAAAQKGLSVGKYHLLKTLEEENHISLQGYEARSIRELNDYVEEKHFVYDGPVVTDSNQVQESASDVGSDTGNSFREESSDQTNDQAKQPAQTDTDDGKKDANDSDKKESADSGQQPGAKKKPLTKESKDKKDNGKTVKNKTKKAKQKKSVKAGNKKKDTKKTGRKNKKKNSGKSNSGSKGGKKNSGKSNSGTEKKDSGKSGSGSSAKNTKESKKS